MAERNCEKCGETVDVAKAFCPACGHAFVEEEKRETKSEFEKVDHTMQMGQTMYNQMLSDMGLNIGKQQKPDESRIDTVVPAAAAPTPVETRTEIVPPANVTSSAIPGFVKWIIIGVAVLFLGLLILFAAGVLFYWFMGRA